MTATTEVRGRLMGPRCVYASTVEVAYPLRAGHGAPAPEANPRIIKRVVIPEPNWWDPISPFLYEGPLELWQDGELCDQRTLRHALRTLKIGSKGLRVNGQPFSIHGTTC